MKKRRCGSDSIIRKRIVYLSERSVNIQLYFKGVLCGAASEYTRYAAQYSRQPEALGATCFVTPDAFHFLGKSGILNRG